MLRKITVKWNEWRVKISAFKAEFYNGGKWKDNNLLKIKIQLLVKSTEFCSRRDSFDYITNDDFDYVFTDHQKFQEVYSQQIKNVSRLT